MGYCKIHPSVEYDLWEECPACKAQRKSSQEAKKRHDELVEAQAQATRVAEEQLEAQRRFAEEQREIAERQTDLLRSQADAAEEALRVHQRRLDAEIERQEEERLRQATEQEHRELRFGLPEFSEAFRTKWYQVGQAKEGLDSDTAVLHRDLGSLNSKIDSTKSRQESEVARIRTVNEREFDSLLEKVRAGGSSNSQQEDSLSRAVRTNTILFTLYTAIFSSPILDRHLQSAGKAFKPLPQISNGNEFLLALLDMAELLKYFPSATKSKIPKGCGIGCAVWVGLCTLGAILPLLSLAGSNRLLLFGQYVLVLAFWWSIVLLVLYFTHFRPRQEQADLDHLRSLMNEFQAQSVAMMEGVWPEVLRQDKGEADPRQNPKALCDNLYTILINDYAEANAERPDLMPDLRRIQGQLQALFAERTAREERFKKEHANQDNIRTQYEYMYKEIRRVGSEILRGRRVPDKKINIVECPQCGGPLSEESQRCPYCGSGLS